MTWSPAQVPQRKAPGAIAAWQFYLYRGSPTQRYKHRKREEWLTVMNSDINNASWLVMAILANNHYWPFNKWVPFFRTFSSVPGMKSCASSSSCGLWSYDLSSSSCKLYNSGAAGVEHWALCVSFERGYTLMKLKKYDEIFMKSWKDDFYQRWFCWLSQVVTGLHRWDEFPNHD